MITNPVISFADNNQKGFHNQPSQPRNNNWQKNPNNNPNKNWNKNNNNQNKNWNQNKNKNWDHRHNRNNTNTIIYYNTVPYYYPNNYNSYDDSYYQITPPDTSTPINPDTSTLNQPYNISTLPNGDWVSANSGSVPNKAYIFQTNNNAPLYYCRAQYKYTTYYGVLIPGAGCSIQDEGAMVNVNEYEALVSTE